MTAAAAEADGERKAEVLIRDDVPKLLAALKEMRDGQARPRQGQGRGPNPKAEEEPAADGR